MGGFVFRRSFLAFFIGGGLYNTGTLTLTQSAVLSNTSQGDGGGIYNTSTLTLDTVTLSGNSATGSGGGLAHGSGTAQLRNSTLSNNRADSDNDGFGNGGGVYRYAGTVNVLNTVIVGNADNPNDLYPMHHDASGAFVSQGYNVVYLTEGSTGFTATTDLTGINPVLTLANNGGPTLSHALQANSLAINSGAGCAWLDQWAYSRDALCDRGAYEVNATAFAAVMTTSYYVAGGQMIAMRETTTTITGTLMFLHTDHLGGTTLVTSITGTVVSRQSYDAYAGMRQRVAAP